MLVEEHLGAAGAFGPHVRRVRLAARPERQGERHQAGLPGRTATFPACVAARVAARAVTGPVGAQRATAVSRVVVAVAASRAARAARTARAIGSAGAPRVNRHATNAAPASESAADVTAPPTSSGRGPAGRNGAASASDRGVEAAVAGL